MYDATATKRQARFRQRQQSGAIYARGNIPRVLAEWLVNRGYKPDDYSTDPGAWFAAVEKALWYAKSVTPLRLPEPPRDREST